jgi:uncharacterized protein
LIKISSVAAIIILLLLINVFADDLNWELTLAAGRGQTETVNTLPAKGADVNEKDNKGITALMRAKQKGYTEIINLLKKAGAKE